MVVWLSAGIVSVCLLWAASLLLHGAGKTVCAVGSYLAETGFALRFLLGSGNTGNELEITVIYLLAVLLLELLLETAVRKWGRKSA